MDKNRFVYQNRNPLKQECTDSVIRALSHVLEKDWLSVYSDLCALGAQLCRMPNDKDCYNAYLAEHGFHRVGISHKKGAKRPTVHSFTVSHPHGIYILQIAHHLVAVRDGLFYDTADHSKKCLYGYWMKKATD